MLLFKVESENKSQLDNMVNEPRCTSRGLKILVSVVRFRPWAPRFGGHVFLNCSETHFHFQKESDYGLHFKTKG